MTTLSKFPKDYDPTDYNWTEAWAAIGDIRRAHPTSTVSLDGIEEDIILAAVEGERDGEPWLAYGVAKDGRYFLLSAWCDYTGWDCQSGGTLTVANTAHELLTYGMTDAEKRELEL